MQKVLFSLSLFFFFIGFLLLKYAPGEADASNDPIILERAGIISIVDISKSSKMGEIFSIKLEGINTWFWLKTQLDSSTKERLQNELHEGDSVTAFYTSLVGTSYEYENAHFNVERLVKNGKNVEGLGFIDTAGPNPILVGMFSVIGNLFLLLAFVLFALVFRLWMNVPR